MSTNFTRVCGVLAVTLLALGCSSTAGQPRAKKSSEETGTKANGQVAPQRAAKYGNTDRNKVRVELLEAGAEPRRALRYKAKKGYVALAQIRTTITNKNDGSTVRDSAFVHSAFVEAVSDDSVTITQLIKATKDGKLVNDLDQLSDESHQTFGASVQYNTRGRPMKFKPVADDAALIKKNQAEVMGLMMAPWLPEEPVGVGATWQIRTPTSVAQPIRANKKTVSKLVAIAGSVITIETTITFDAPKQTVNGKEYEGQKIRGKKRITVDLADPVSLIPKTFENTQDMSVTQKKLGMSVTHNMHNTSSSTRIGEAVASE